MATVSDPLDPHAVPVCSVCVANYNGADIISACLDSILGQELDDPIEIIVHDDASTDGSAEIVRSDFPNVYLITSEVNVGYCVSNNRMASAARGRYLLLLNNDARLRPGALQALLVEAETNAPDAILTLPQYDAATGQLLDMGSVFDPFLNPVPNLNPKRSEVGMVMGACLWCPRALWNELGGFPEWFGSLAEDMYLCLAAWNTGHPVRAIPRSGYDHWVGRSLGGGKVVSSKLTTTYRRRALSERNKTFVMLIYYPTPLLVALLPLHLGLLALEGVLLMALRRDARIWREIYRPTYGALLRERTRLQQIRAIAQAQRRIGITKFLRLFSFIPRKLLMLVRHGIPRLT